MTNYSQCNAEAILSKYY